MTTPKKMLKPCPFCGGKKIIFFSNDHGPNTVGFLKCLGCYAQTGLVLTTYENAIKAWNTRQSAGVSVETLAKEMFEVCMYPNPERWEEQDDATKSRWIYNAEIIHAKITGEA